MNTHFATIEPSKNESSFIGQGAPFCLTIPELEKRDALVLRLTHCFQQISSSLQSNQLPTQIIDEVYFPWGEDQAKIINGRKLMTRGASLDIEKYAPPEAAPNTFAFREKLHLRHNSLSWLPSALNSDDWSFFSAFFSLLSTKIGAFEKKLFGRDLSEHYDNQFLLIHYSQQSESYDPWLHQMGSSTFGNIHEDETLFSFHIAESLQELRLFDYSKHQWLTPPLKDYEVQVLLGQESRRFGYCPTPHRLDANTSFKIKSRFSFIVERVPKKNLQSQTLSRPELLRFQKPEVREKLTAFIFWDTFFDEQPAPKYIVDLTEDLARLHLYFLIKNNNKKLVRYQAEKNTFEKLENQGFKYVVCVRPGFMLKCENVVEELLNLAVSNKEKYFIHHYHKELREGVSLALLGNGRGHAIDLSLSKNGVLKTLFELPNDHVDQLQTKIYSHNLSFQVQNKSDWPTVVQKERAEIERHLQDGFSSTFVFNTEGYQDIIKSQFIKEPVHAVGFASGFKLNFICQQYQPLVKKISYVDANINSLKLKQDLAKNWNGENFNSWFSNYWQNRFPIYEKDPLFLNQRWQREIEVWDGALEIQKHWLWFQKQEIDFQNIDVIAEAERFKNIFDPNMTVIFWASNLWHNEFVSYLFDHIGVGNAYLNWLKKINSLHPRIFLYQDDVPHGETWIKPNNKWVSDILAEYGLA